jgi:hypothetical protein
MTIEFGNIQITCDDHAYFRDIEKAGVDTILRAMAENDFFDCTCGKATAFVKRYFEFDPLNIKVSVHSKCLCGKISKRISFNINVERTIIEQVDYLF